MNAAAGQRLEQRRRNTAKGPADLEGRAPGRPMHPPKIPRRGVFGSGGSARASSSGCQAISLPRRCCELGQSPCEDFLCCYFLYLTQRDPPTTGARSRSRSPSATLSWGTDSPRAPAATPPPRFGLGGQMPEDFAACDEGMDEEAAPGERIPKRAPAGHQTAHALSPAKQRTPTSPATRASWPSLRP